MLPFSENLFWHIPFGRQTSAVNSSVLLLPEGFDRPVAQHMEDSGSEAELLHGRCVRSVVLVPLGW
jgi:hypothetical protein